MKDRSELFNELYELLRTLAQKKLIGDRGSSDATSLVHEAYLKLCSREQAFTNDQHFLATASQAMRQILVDRARARNSKKRNAEMEPLTLSTEGPKGQTDAIGVLVLNELLERLAEFDDRAAQITEMRFFLGLSEEEIAQALGVSTRTVKRDWAIAKAWLAKEMNLRKKPEKALSSSDGRKG